MSNCKLIPVSVNWHVWPRCNYSCRFCYATFKSGPKPLDKEVALQIPGMLKVSGTEKLTFAGGEPTLCPYLGDLLKESKDVGLTTTMVTNGSLLDRAFLERWHSYIDWIALSIDSASEETETRLGRGRGGHMARVVGAAELIKSYSIRLKVNTVITSLNWNEDMAGIIKVLEPERWKVFQVLGISGENDAHFSHLSVSKEQFRSFADRHKHLNPVVEDNGAMEGSYIMLDPAGRFFQNFNNEYFYSRSILEVGVERAFTEVGWDSRKFFRRGGLYEW